MLECGQSLFGVSKVVGAHGVAYPAISRMLNANPQAQAQAVNAVRFREKPELKRQSDDREVLLSSLDAVVGDLRREVGAPDEIEQVALGATPKPNGAFTTGDSRAGGDPAAAEACT